MSSNTETIEDSDGDYPDWIELYNQGNIEINLSEFGLSDDPDEPFKWIFPTQILESFGHYSKPILVGILT